MRKYIQFLIILLIVGVTYYYKEEIVDFFADTIVKMEKKNIIIPSTNEYKIENTNFAYVENTEKFIPETRQDIMNIMFTILNSGWNEFTFYCPDEYVKCMDEVVSITNDDVLLSNINGYVHPYNSFKSLETSYNDKGKVTITVHKIYDVNMINLINEVADKMYNDLIKVEMNDSAKIKAIHDYIINNSKYDNDRINGSIQYKSNTAYGNLIQKYGICSGYTDAMALFLYKMNIPNYKVSSEKHIWNLVYINEKWLHLDLTFNDPVTNTGEDVLLHDYFLINTKKLWELDTKEHIFDESVFIEAKAS